jgi:cyclophilin family peptidyl-prolyl cis-trans isomerase
VGTAKRQRQKAGRQSRREEAEAAARKARHRSSFLRYGAFAALIVGIIVLFAVLRRDTGGSTSSTSPSTTAAPAPSTTLVAAYGSSPCPPTGGAPQPAREWNDPFQKCIDPAKSYTALVKTNKGALTIQLDAKSAPITVNNFVVLSEWKFYDGLTCHRIIPNFAAQCGDPTGNGTGGPGYKFGDELPAQGAYKIGSVAMANSGPGTNGSQFFIITGDDGTKLPPDYSLFGQVVNSDATIAALNAVGNPDPNANGVPPKETVTISSVTITES